MLKNFRFISEDQSYIQCEDDAGTTLNIPVDLRNAHYREQVRPLLGAGITIAPYDPPRAPPKRDELIIVEQIDALLKQVGQLPTPEFSAVTDRLKSKAAAR